MYLKAQNRLLYLLEKAGKSLIICYINYCRRKILVIKGLINKHFLHMHPDFSGYHLQKLLSVTDTVNLIPKEYLLTRILPH